MTRSYEGKAVLGPTVGVFDRGTLGKALGKWKLC